MGNSLWSSLPNSYNHYNRIHIYLLDSFPCIYVHIEVHGFVFIYLFFWLYCVFIAVQTFLLLVVSRGYSLVAMCRLLIVVASLTVEPKLWACRLQQLHHMGSVVRFPGALEHSLSGCGLVALRHVGSSGTRNQTCVSCMSRQILYHWTTMEALVSVL